ncbi:ATP-grasp domain-containing protein [Methylophilus sp. 5]|uniref:ATP-grasp domain-containing protein n=1 Tax=Methylophilus sp. 5 TaxID=1112274 RepID=UPI0004AD831E|nr:ATP-grasp domain-containing protein [Methylophilus sp. 5]
MYSQMAQQEGFSVLAVDAFADVDTRQAAQQVYQWPGLYEQATNDHMAALFEVLESFEPDAVLVGSGFEANQAGYAALLARYTVPGNAAEAINRANNPQWLKACCDAHGVQSPLVTHTRPTAGQWLYKQAGQCGGAHVHDWQGASTEVEQGYWQVFQPGQAVGILFLAHAQTYQLIGVHALRQHVGSYAYAGATRLHDDALKVAASQLLQALVPALGLIGINSIDAIWHENTLHVIEVNPRLSASMRLYCDLPLIQAHIASCQAEAMPALQPRDGFASHCILYARQTINVSQLSFPNWLEDQPSGGNIAAGQPICSIYADGDSEREVQLALRNKKTRLETLWGTYVCDRIEFNIH